MRARNLFIAFAVAALAHGAVIPNRAPLEPNAFDPLPLGAVHARGWLLQQERIQAEGLTGHLDEFWNDVGPNSGWLGGTGESWERGPYYLDGLLPLAYQLNDGKLIAKAKKWVDWTLNSQQPNGQFGPASNDDWWPRMVMLKVLTQYEEVSGDPRVLPFMSKYFRYQLSQLPGRPLRDWGKYRWHDNVYSVLWLYNRTGEPQLLSLAKLLHEQGYDWEAQFDHFRFTHKMNAAELGLGKGGPPPDLALQTHGVNNAMALKAAPIWWLLSRDASDQTGLWRQLDMLDRYHGIPNGMFSADEHLAGLEPSQGVELCAVVEAMFSYEEDFAILGDSSLADRLERVAYNALPGTLSDDMWSHQYDQQPNQIACTRAHRQWSTNGPDSNLFGLEPNFGCCTANLHQGWPKLTSALWMSVPEGGLVTTAYAPSDVQTEINGTQVGITEDTLYPFRGDVKLTVNDSKPTEFSLFLRIPKWAESATVKINQTAPDSPDQVGARPGFYRIRRTWKTGDTVQISFAMKPRVSHWYNNSVAFERGPLVFSLPLDAQWTELKKYAQKSGDWQLTSPHPWNFAVAIGDCDVDVKDSAASSGLPFSRSQPAVSLMVEGKQIAAWKEKDNSAGPPPQSPVSSDQRVEKLALVPYGAAKLRITEFPFLSEASSCSGSHSAATNAGQ